MNTIAEFDKTNKPIVSVKFTGNTITSDGYNEFINNWNQCDEEKTDYNYFFDVSKGIGPPSLKYAFGIAGFIMRKKREPTIYLKHSIIYITSTSSRTLLRLVFNISSPIAPVYIINNIEVVDILNTYIATYRENHGKYPSSIPYNDVIVFMP
tara:strand:- start:750 stop:1205 length:456 start_codon:yes stop_codon:yes gene_type:complete